MGLTQEATSCLTLQGAVVSVHSSWTLWGKGSVSAVKQSRTKLQGADFAGLGFQNSLLLFLLYFIQPCVPCWQGRRREQATQW